jgi:hypothetical protein
MVRDQTLTSLARPRFGGWLVCSRGFYDVMAFHTSMNGSVGNKAVIMGCLISEHDRSDCIVVVLPE